MSDPAIQLVDVVKIYKLYGSPAAQAADLVGLGGILPRRAARPFRALDGVSLTLSPGERVAVIGRNGAGKSTLLRLVNGKASPDGGRLIVNGRVQALMEIGVGFHDDFSGLDNIRTALTYGQLAGADLAAAVDEIVEFCELGDFIHQPLRTYSSGMRMRIFFAVATAIKPEILIIDEVLGAGDQYFAARSAQRLRDLALNGCTLLLVTHSMQQALDFCPRAVWLEGGRVVMEGATLAVVKAYEEFCQHLAQVSGVAPQGEAITQDPVRRTEVLDRVLKSQASISDVDGGLSRWPASGKMRVIDCWSRGTDGVRGPVASDAPFEIVLRATVNDPLVSAFRVAIVIFSRDGNWITRLVSPPLNSAAVRSREVHAIARIDRCVLAAGDYVLSASLHEANEPWDLLTAERYDLVSRSFKLSVGGPATEALASIPAQWDVLAERVVACA